MRERLEAGRGGDLKRGRGGLLDVEFLVQLFHLEYGRVLPELRTPNTWEALDALRGAGLLSEAEHADLQAGYDFVLRVLSRLRIVHNRSLIELPASAAEVEKLARRLGFDSGGRLRAELEKHRGRMCGRFLEILQRERNRPVPGDIASPPNRLSEPPPAAAS
jgi:glutamate-ammonia-ligase adenylyltransferase